jgi:arsenate reductase-like glutaredoxin family protein
MNIQLFGKSKCFDTKKAQRYFKERGIKVHDIDLGKKAMSRGELLSVLKAVGGLGALIDEGHPDATLLRYLAYEEDKVEKLLENPRLLRTPIVRNGQKATVGYAPEVWKAWE